MGAYKLLLAVNFFKKKIRNTIDLLANFANLARYSLIILGWLVLPGAQATSVQKIGEVYYEYTDAVKSPYTQILNGATYFGKTTSEMDERFELLVNGNANVIRTRLGGDRYICDAGKVEIYQQTSQEGAYSGEYSVHKHLVGVMLTQAPDSPYRCSNPVGPYNPSLARHIVRWSFECPHGYQEAGVNSAGKLICRRPVNSPCMKQCGNPITHAGEKKQPELDYRSADGSLELRRTFSSARYPEPGWTNNYETRVLFALPFTSVIRADGSRLHFEFKDGAFKAIQPTQASLIKTPTGFTFTDSQDLSETYDSSGTLIGLRYRDGKTVSVERRLDGATGILTATDTYGRKLVLEYAMEEGSDELLLSKATLPDGTEFKYKNDSATSLLSNVTREGYSRRYEYEAFKGFPPFKKRLLGITDENNKSYAQFTNAGATASTQHSGNVERYEVTDNRATTGTGKVTVIEPLGETATYTYANVNGISQLVAMTRGTQGTSSMAYDARGNLASQLDFNGNLTRYTHDLARNLETSRTEGLSKLGAVTPETRTTETTWHPEFRLPTQILVKGSNGQALQQTNMDYDHFGHMIRHSVKDVVKNTVRTSSFNYRYSSTMPWHVEELKVIGPRTDVPDTSIISYWPFDATCSGSDIGQDKGCRGKMKTVTNSANQTTHYEMYDAHGRATAIRNPNGLLTEMTYTSRGWLTATTVGDETTRYEYDGVGLMKKVTLPNNATLTYHYDDAQRLASVTDNLGNKVSYVLDNMGNRTSEVVKDATGNIKRQIARIYDTLNRLTQVTGAAQ